MTPLHRSTRIHLPYILLVILLLSFGITGCGAPSARNPTTATAQYGQIHSLATQMAQQVQATTEVERVKATQAVQKWEDLYQSSQGWPVLFSDNFTDNANNWPVGDEDGEYTTISWKIEDGKYHWEATAKQGFIYWTQPDISEAGDFFLAVDGQMLGAPQDGDYGLIFRKIDGDNYYVFRIDQQQQYSVDQKRYGSWYTEIDWSSSDAILAEGVNHLVVIGLDNEISFFINGKYLSSISDQPNSQSSAGVAIEMYNAGDQGVFEFQNFIFRSPEVADTAPPE